MPVIGFPTTLDSFLNTSLNQVGLSSYKIAANSDCTTVVLDFRNMANGQSLTRDYATPATWRKKSPSVRRRDNERMKNFKTSSKAHDRFDTNHSTPFQVSNSSNSFHHSQSSSGFGESRSIFLSPASPQDDRIVAYQPCVKHEHTLTSNSTQRQNVNNDTLYRNTPCSYKSDNERDLSATDHNTNSINKVPVCETELIACDSDQHVSNYSIDNNTKSSPSPPALTLNSTIEPVSIESTHQPSSLQNFNDTSNVCKQTNEPSTHTDTYDRHSQHSSHETDKDLDRCAEHTLHTEDSTSDGDSHTSGTSDGINDNEHNTSPSTKQYKDPEDFLIFSCEDSTPETELNMCSTDVLDETEFGPREFVDYTSDLPRKTKTRVKSNSRNCFFRRLKEKPGKNEDSQWPIMCAETDDLLIEFDPNIGKIVNFSVTTGKLVDYELRNIGAFRSLPELNPKQFPQQLLMLKKATANLLRIVKQVLQ